MREIKTIAVYCGSNFGNLPDYRAAALELGEALAKSNIKLVYGGTHKGLMGALADSIMAAGGSAQGVITTRLHEKGHLHPGLKEFEIVTTMRERKARMIEQADAFIALPGGIGTLEEFMEVWTLNQLGEIDKPAGLFNISGYYNAFTTFVDHMVVSEFLPPAHRHSVIVESNAGDLIKGLRTFEKSSVSKWMS
jgi:uncharacterized protein (TIGR00730 family)